MLDLRDDGTIGIDFEDGQSPVVLARPKFGAYKRLRADLAKISTDLLAFLTELRAQDPPPEPAEINARTQEKNDELTIAWWLLIFVGDDSFKSLVESGTAPPSPDDWPAWLIYGSGGVLSQVVEHWRRTPLARGGVLVTETPEPTTE